MQRVRMALMALIAVFAIGVVGATAASAGDFNGKMYTNVGDCEFSGDTNDWSAEGLGWATDLSNFVKDPILCPGTVSSVDGEAHIWKDASGDATISDVEVTLTLGDPPNEIVCTYLFAGPVFGEWALVEGRKVFNFQPVDPVEPELDPGSDLLCGLLVVEISQIELDISPNP